MIRRLKLQIIAIIMLISTALLVLGVVMIYHTTRINLEQDSLSVMRSVSLTPGQVILPEQGEDDMRLPVFTLYKEEDGTLSAYGGLDYDLSDQNFLRQLYEEVQAREGETGIIEAYQLRFLKISRPEEAYIVFSDISFERNTLTRLLHTALAVALSGLGAILLVSILLANIAVRPVEQAWLAQKQFIADASHELKTPLTVILTNAEMLQSGSFDKEDQLELTDNMLDMSRQMKGLVEKMLQLARADRLPEKEEMVNVDLSRIVENAVMVFEPLCYEKGFPVKTDIQEQIVVRGSSQELQRLCAILLDNALKYADAGTPIAVTLHRSGKSGGEDHRCVTHRDHRFSPYTCLLSRRQNAILTVSNQCSVADPSLEKNAFKRFYRGDAARSMDHSYGLGLSIAEAIVRRHGGQIIAHVENSQVSFQVQLRCNRAGKM